MSKFEMRALGFVCGITDVFQGLARIVTLGFWRPGLTIRLVELHMFWHLSRQIKRERGP